MPPFCFLLQTVFFFELVYSSACVHQFLFTREIRVTLVADFNFDDICVLGSTRLEGCAASTYNSRLMIIRMYTLFHFSHLTIYFAHISYYLAIFLSSNLRLSKILTHYTRFCIQYNMRMDEIPRRVHFVGCGGVGMSGLCEHLLRLGYAVTGSDRTANDRTVRLEQLGIKVHIGHDINNVGDAELVVHTSAVPVSNVEVSEAISRNIPVVLREELLGAVFDSFETRIAVCGTHGKTTVTAMLHQMLCEARVDHAAFIGGVYRGDNYYFGAKCVVAEACEFNRSFLNLHPTLCVCLNAELDHPDCYKDVEDVRRAFQRFLASVGKTGCVVLPAELKNLFPHRNRVLFDKNYVVSNLKLIDGCPSFDVTDANGELRRVELSVPGVHNVRNALATLAVADVLRLPADAVCSGLKNFVGVDRRWTEVPVAGLGKVVLDYAHHPTALACSIATAKSVTKGRVLCVFQPHTYSRTKAFWQQFADCFTQADAVAYLPVYSAREKPIVGVNSYLLSQQAAAQGINACFLPDFLSAKQWIFGNATKDDTVLILGAGDVVALADLL